MVNEVSVEPEKGKKQGEGCWVDSTAKLREGLGEECLGFMLMGLDTEKISEHRTALGSKDTIYRKYISK